MKTLGTLPTYISELPNLLKGTKMKFDWNTRHRRGLYLDIFQHMRNKDDVDMEAMANNHKISIAELNEYIDIAFDCHHSMELNNSTEIHGYTSEIASLANTIIKQDIEIKELNKVLRGIATRTSKFL